MTSKRTRVAAWVVAAVVVVGGAALYAHRGMSRYRLKIAYLDAAEHAMHGGDLEGCERAYRRALKIDPRFLAARTALADTYATEGRSEDAIAEHRRGVRADPRNPQAYLALGRALIEYHRYEEAAKTLECAVRLAPRDVHLHIALMHAYRWCGDVTRAKRELAAIQRLAPGSEAVRAAMRAMAREARRRGAPRAGSGVARSESAR